MLLAEALAERAEAQNRLKKLTERLGAVARVQEGDTPEEDPQALLEEAEALFGTIAAAAPIRSVFLFFIQPSTAAGSLQPFLV